MSVNYRVDGETKCIGVDLALGCQYDAEAEPSDLVYADGLRTVIARYHCKACFDVYSGRFDAEVGKS